MEKVNKYGEIILTDTYKITRLDKYCLALLRKITRTRKDSEEQYEDWEIAGYHGDLTSALLQARKELLHNSLFEKDINIDELISKVEQIEKETREIIKGIKVIL